jgi:large subunit ribosomal protein L16
MQNYIPNKTNYAKYRKGKNFFKINKPFSIFDLYKKSLVRLVIAESGKLKSKQLISCRQTINKILKKKSVIESRVLADTPVTKKPIEVRMGKGKGNVDHWILKANIGKTLFEVYTYKKKLTKNALSIAQLKLPVHTFIL